MKMNCPLCGTEREIDVEVDAISVHQVPRPRGMGGDTMLDITFRSARDTHYCEPS